MDEKQRQILIENMVSNLPALRKVLGVSQEGLADILGVSRTTLAVVENRKRKMTWDMFLALLMVFTKNKATDQLLGPMGIYTDEFNAFIKFVEPKAK